MSAAQNRRVLAAERRWNFEKMHREKGSGAEVVEVLQFADLAALLCARRSSAQPVSKLCRKWRRIVKRNGRRQVLLRRKLRVFTARNWITRSYTRENVFVSFKPFLQLVRTVQLFGQRSFEFPECQGAKIFSRNWIARAEKCEISRDFGKSSDIETDNNRCFRFKNTLSAGLKTNEDYRVSAVKLHNIYSDRND